MRYFSAHSALNVAKSELLFVGSLQLEPIEYIGTRPRPKKSRPLVGGWVLLVLALGAGFFLLQPLFPYLQAQQSRPNATNLTSAVGELRSEETVAGDLAAAALERTREEVVYDLTYRVIDYPGGDIPLNRGKGEDVIVRAYRALGVDLQELVHEDMSVNFRLYPQFWGLKRPDPNIDHRRAPNLLRFLSRFGQSFPPSHAMEEYEVGDIVAWHLPERTMHVGIVVPGPGQLGSEKWVVHNAGAGPKWEDALFSYEVIGHYRYLPEENSRQVLAELK